MYCNGDGTSATQLAELQKNLAESSEVPRQNTRKNATESQLW